MVAFYDNSMNRFLVDNEIVPSLQINLNTMELRQFSVNKVMVTEILN